MAIRKNCPSCQSSRLQVFYEISGVPVHSVRLLHSRQQALDYPTGDIRLGFCQDCGFISNLAFDSSLQDYSVEYESTQAFSPTFNAFAQSLASRLVERYKLYNKDIIELGCGQGEFLSLLCELGDNRGVGFDPAYVDGRLDIPSTPRINFIKDYYNEGYSGYQADFIACKMTLEHIWNVTDFVRSIRRSIGNRTDTVVFFQVPDVLRILQEGAFWDIYYEHCSYFSAGSLARLFRRSGFDVLDLAREYDDQYLMIEARPGNGLNTASPVEEDRETLKQALDQFVLQCRRKSEAWKRELYAIKERDQRAVLWGGGSKAVAFLTTLRVESEIGYAVDINPFKQRMYLAGTGQEVVPPEFLKAYHPDMVIAMNPIYCQEIERFLKNLEVTAEVKAL